MSEISREEAIKELKEYAENSWGDLSEAFNQAISDMEKLEKIEKTLEGTVVCKYEDGYIIPIETIDVHDKRIIKEYCDGLK